MSDREPNPDLLFIVEALNETKVGWYARVIVYRSPTGLADDPRADYVDVLEVGRKSDLIWARKHMRYKHKGVKTGAFAR